MSAKWDGSEVRKAQADLLKLQKQLDTLNGKKIQIQVDVAGSEDIDKMKVDLDSIRDETIAKVAADMGDSKEKIDDIRAKLDALGTKTARPKVDVDTGPARRSLDFLKAKIKAFGAQRWSGGIFGSLFGGGGGKGGNGGGGGGGFNFAAITTQLNMVGMAMLALNGILGAGILLLGALGAAGALAGGALMLGLPVALAAITAKFALMTTAGKKAAAQLKADLGSTIQSAAQPMVNALIGAFGQIDAGIKKLGPSLNGLFAAAAPTIKPLVNAILLFVQAALPGMTAALKAAAPVLDGFQSGMQDLGRNINQMFVGLSKGAPGFGSAIRLAFGQVGVLLGQLGTAFGQTSAGGASMLQGLLFGINTLISNMNNQLIPAIQTMGPTIGSFFSSLGASIGSLLGSIFKGVQILGPAIAPLAGFLSSLANGLGSLVTGLASGLTPAIRVMAAPLSNLVEVLGTSLGGALKTILPVLGQLIADLATALAPVLQQLLPPLADVIAQLLSGFAPVIKAIAAPLADVATGLGEVLNWLKPIMPILGPLAVGFWALDAAMAANPVGVVVVAIAALVGGIVYLATKTQFFQKLWNAVWDGIKTGFDAFVNFMRTPFGAFATLLLGPIGVLMVVAANWKTIWGGIKDAALDVWHAINVAWDDTGKALKKTWDTVSSAVKNAWDSFWSELKSDAVKPWQEIDGAWHDTINGIKSTWDTISNDISGAWHDFWTGLVNTAKTIWTGIEDVFKTPINVVIGIWDNVAGVFGLPQVNKLAGGGPVGNAATGGHAFADGGHIRGRGTGTSDDIPAWLSDGEFVMPAARVQQYGLGTMEAMRRGKFADGGVVSSVTNAVGGFVSQGLNALKNITANVAYDTTAPLVHGVESAVPDPFLPGVTEPMGGVPKDMVTKVGDGILSIFKQKQDAAKAAMAAIGGALPTVEHMMIIQAALRRAGVSQAQWGVWEAGLNTLITRESGWDPNAINMTDSNALAGHPSQGLAQVIPGTFAAYGLGGSITDPVSNLVAAIRYIISRYGDITMVQQANANMPPKGYDMGGPLLPGMTLAHNTTGSVEGVLNPVGLATIGGLGNLSVLNAGGNLTSASAGALGGGPINIELNIEVNSSAQMDVDELVEKVKDEVIPELTMAIVAKVGTR